MEQGIAVRRQQYLEGLREGLVQEVCDILNAIDLLPMRIGCKPFEDSIEDEILIIEIGKFIVASYRGMTGAEIINAFDLAARRELMFDGKVVHPNTYNMKLSINIVGLILTAHRTHCNNLRAQAQRYVEPPKQLEAGPVLTPAAAFQMFVEMCGPDREFPAIFGPWASVYEHLLMEELIDDWSEEKIRGLREKARLNLTKGQPLSRTTRVTPEAIDKEMRELSVITFFQEQGYNYPKSNK